MSAVCRQLIDHLKLKCFSQATIQNYVECVSRCVRHFNKPPLPASRCSQWIHAHPAVTTGIEQTHHLR